jgi:hypothetical protein
MSNLTNRGLNYVYPLALRSLVDDYCIKNNCKIKFDVLPTNRLVRLVCDTLQRLVIQ